MAEQLSLFDAAEAAACLWEEVLENRDRPDVRAAFDNCGSADLRATVCGWAEPVHRDWEEASANGYDDPFDFEFVPAWIKANATFSEAGAVLAVRRSFPMMSAAVANAAPAAPTSRSFTIDVWEGESIWSWDGVAGSEDEAREAALAQINEDWEREYPDWAELAMDVDGTALMEHPAVMAPRLPLALLEQVEGFLVGFEDDEMQTGVTDMLRQVRQALRLCRPSGMAEG
jgi:hypothetical protein